MEKNISFGVQGWLMANGFSDATEFGTIQHKIMISKMVLELLDSLIISFYYKIIVNSMHLALSKWLMQLKRFNFA